MVVADVFSRIMFNAPIIGVMEIIKMTIPVIAFFMFPWATHESRHVRSTIIYGNVPTKVRVIIDFVAYMLGMVLFILIIVSSWPEFLNSAAINEFEGEGALRVITWPTRGLIIFSSFLIALQMLRCAVMTVLRPPIDIPTDY
jgi:TRAP-type mannitol/chloroaromatic compound transport system permease small subunit